MLKISQGLSLDGLGVVWFFEVLSLSANFFLRLLYRQTMASSMIALESLADRYRRVRRLKHAASE